MVILDDSRKGKERLVAYIVPDGEGETVISSARDFLRQQLPDYMVPSVFMQIDEIKSTPNGKVDYRQLPAPEVDRHVAGSLVAPSGELENTVATLWKKVLELDEIGVEDNFFDLGGDSFLMIQLHTLLEETLSRKIPVTDLFRFSTIHSFAAHYGEQRPATAKTDATRSRAEKQRAAMRKIRRGR